MSNPIDRQDAIDAIHEAFCYAYCDNCENEMNEELCEDCHRKYQNWSASKKTIEKVINALPSAQPEPSIPISWIDEQIEWLKGLDNGFSTITAMQILTMVNKWNREGGQNE